MARGGNLTILTGHTGCMLPALLIGWLGRRPLDRGWRSCADVPASCMAPASWVDGGLRGRLRGGAGRALTPTALVPAAALRLLLLLCCTGWQLWRRAIVGR